jgi:hypothetical protein
MPAFCHFDEFFKLKNKFSEFQNKLAFFISFLDFGWPIEKGRLRFFLGIRKGLSPKRCC